MASDSSRSSISESAFEDETLSSHASILASFYRLNKFKNEQQSDDDNAVVAEKTDDGEKKQKCAIKGVDNSIEKRADKTDDGKKKQKCAIKGVDNPIKKRADKTDDGEKKQKCAIKGVDNPIKKRADKTDDGEKKQKCATKDVDNPIKKRADKTDDGEKKQKCATKDVDNPIEKRADKTGEGEKKQKCAIKGVDNPIKKRADKTDDGEKEQKCAIKGVDNSIEKRADKTDDGKKKQKCAIKGVDNPIKKRADKTDDAEKEQKCATKDVDNPIEKRADKTDDGEKEQKCATEDVDNPIEKRADKTDDGDMASDSSRSSISESAFEDETLSSHASILASFYRLNKFKNEQQSDDDNAVVAEKTDDGEKKQKCAIKGVDNSIEKRADKTDDGKKKQKCAIKGVDNPIKKRADKTDDGEKKQKCAIKGVDNPIKKRADKTDDGEKKQKCATKDVDNPIEKRADKTGEGEKKQKCATKDVDNPIEKRADKTDDGEKKQKCAVKGVDNSIEKRADKTDDGKKKQKCAIKGVDNPIKKRADKTDDGEKKQKCATKDVDNPIEKRADKTDDGEKEQKCATKDVDNPIKKRADKTDDGEKEQKCATKDVDNAIEKRADKTDDGEKEQKCATKDVDNAIEKRADKTDDGEKKQKCATKDVDNAIEKRADKKYSDLVVKTIEKISILIKPYLTISNNKKNEDCGLLSWPMQRKLLAVIKCQVMDVSEERLRCYRMARSLGKRCATEFLLQYQDPQLLSAQLCGVLREHNCIFLGPIAQDHVLKLIFETLTSVDNLDRDVLIKHVIKECSKNFQKPTYKCIYNVLHLLSEASCFTVTKPKKHSWLVQFKHEFRCYEELRRRHDRQLVKMATEAQLCILPEQYSILLYADDNHAAYMRAICNKFQISFPTIISKLNETIEHSLKNSKAGEVNSKHGAYLRGQERNFFNLSIITSDCSVVPTWRELSIALKSGYRLTRTLIEYLEDCNLHKISHNKNIIWPFSFNNKKVGSDVDDNSGGSLEVNDNSVKQQHYEMPSTLQFEAPVAERKSPLPSNNAIDHPIKIEPCVPESQHRQPELLLVNNDKDVETRGMHLSTEEALCLEALKEALDPTRVGPSLVGLSSAASLSPEQQKQQLDIEFQKHIQLQDEEFLKLRPQKDRNEFIKTIWDDPTAINGSGKYVPPYHVFDIPPPQQQQQQQQLRQNRSAELDLGVAFHPRRENHPSQNQLNWAPRTRYQGPVSPMTASNDTVFDNPTANNGSGDALYQPPHHLFDIPPPQQQQQQQLRQNRSAELDLGVAFHPRRENHPSQNQLNWAPRTRYQGPVSPMTASNDTVFDNPTAINGSGDALDQPPHHLFDIPPPQQQQQQQLRQNRSAELDFGVAFHPRRENPPSQNQLNWAPRTRYQGPGSPMNASNDTVFDNPTAINGSGDALDQPPYHAFDIPPPQQQQQQPQLRQNRSAELDFGVEFHPRRENPPSQNQLNWAPRTHYQGPGSPMNASNDTVLDDPTANNGSGDALYQPPHHVFDIPPPQQQQQQQLRQNRSAELDFGVAFHPRRENPPSQNQLNWAPRTRYQRPVSSTNAANAMHSQYRGSPRPILGSQRPMLAQERPLNIPGSHQVPRFGKQGVSERPPVPSHYYRIAQQIIDQVNLCRQQRAAISEQQERRYEELNQRQQQNHQPQNRQLQKEEEEKEQQLE